MKLRSLRVEKSPELMIIPMIDIIFFLLVFFMLSSMNMIAQQSIPVSLPKAANAQQEVPKPVNVTVQHDGAVSIDKEALGSVSVREKLQGMVQPDTVVILRADKEIDHGRVVEVLDEIKAAGVKHVSIAAEQKAR